jgi:uncharacterized protein
VASKFIQETQLHRDYPLPDVDDPIMRPFWDGCHAGRFLQQRDRVTGALHWPPKPQYWKGGQRLEWFEHEGVGEVYTYVVGSEPFLPAFKHLLPHIMVVTEVRHGSGRARLVGHMVHCSPAQMRFGMRVRVVFKRLTDRVTLPVWEPAQDGG